MLSTHVSILTGEDYSNAFQTCKYSDRCGLFECYPTNIEVLSQKRIIRILSKLLTILTEVGLLECFPNLLVFSWKRYIQMLSKHISILREEYHSNAFQTYKYFQRRRLLECCPNM